MLPTHGGEPHLLYEEPASEPFRKLDWTADGRCLAIASMRGGKAALHLLPVKDGQPAGTPVFVRYGNNDEGYTTKGGAFIYSTVKPGGFIAGHVASLDSNGRPGNWQRLEFRGDNLEDPHPHWSPDGIQIVYGTSDDTGSRAVVRNASTGEEREIYHGRVGNCIWGAEQTKIFCTDSYLKAKLISIRADSGESERLGPRGTYVSCSEQPRRAGDLLLERSIGSCESDLRERIVRSALWTVRAACECLPKAGRVADVRHRIPRAAMRWIGEGFEAGNTHTAAKWSVDSGSRDSSGQDGRRQPGQCLRRRLAHVAGPFPSRRERDFHEIPEHLV